MTTVDRTAADTTVDTTVADTTVDRTVADTTVTVGERSACPVTGVETDLDIFYADFVRDPFPTYAHLRAAARWPTPTEWGGQWMPTRYEDIEAIARNSEQFSSITVSVTGPKPGEGSLFIGPPVTLDPPEHAPARRLLLPAFAPKAVERLDADHPGHRPGADRGDRWSGAATGPTPPSTTPSTCRCG